ncbi:MAG: hypothetical protein IRY94_06060 [Rhodospirillaceae bacterium]|nr:hypothetical protein [Rhodospirillaceae bacterium]
MDTPHTKEIRPFAVIPLRSDDFEGAVERRAVEAAVGRLRRSTCRANLGTFSGYRIGLDIGNGNIGWCVLFEEGRDEALRLRFLTAEDIKAHNAALPRSAPRTQLPDLCNFVPLGVHKFDARESLQKGEKSLSKIRAEGRARRRTLDARQTRRMYVKKALQDAGLLPKDGEPLEGATKVKADVLRVKLLDPAFPAHSHDLGRALYNVLKRRGWMPPMGRAGLKEDTGFGKVKEEEYRKALAQFGCRTIGEFLDRCARDAKRDGIRRFRKRHSPLTWQEEHRKEKPKDLAAARSYECFRFLTPTFGLVWEEARLLARQRHHVRIPCRHWKAILKAARHRRPLRARSPGRCRFFRTEFRCVRALPSFQLFRILEQVSNLRDANGKPLDDASFKCAVALLGTRDKMTLAALSRALGGGALRFDKGDYAGRRALMGAVTDTALADALGDAWRALPIGARDEWTLRFLRRHPVDDHGRSPAWSARDERTLRRDADVAFGPGALKKVDERAARALQDTFSGVSLKAARLLADCYAKRLPHDARMEALRAAGSEELRLELYERLPYYGAVMPDQVVPATEFAPAERTCTEELKHGRAANPDLHVVLNRVRAVVNAIVEMMGGILPTRCVIEMARSALSEEQANAHSKKNRDREKLRQAIVAEIETILGARTPAGPGLERLVERWKAAERQGWRDYDGSEIQRSRLIDGAEYQLDHVVPAAFGDYRENNMFVSRYNSMKGRRLPWEAFGSDAKFRPALLAFATFGVEQNIATIEQALKRASGRRGKELDEALERAREEKEELKKHIGEDEPHPDVLAALRRTVSGRRVAPGDDDQAEAARTIARNFDPREQAALFRRFHPDRKPPQGGPAARDVANIGWSTKLALRYLRHLGAETEAIKAWAVHALRCMFGINKCREDLRNHAVDAFLVAHFDKELLQPAFARLRHEFGYEALYDPCALEEALSHFAGGADLLSDFRDNLDGLEKTLPLIGTAHRPDHKWNPGDASGAGLGAFGGENIYSFRPTLAERKSLTSQIRLSAAGAAGTTALTREQILELLLDNKNRSDASRIRDKAIVRYRRRSENMVVPLSLNAVAPLCRQPGAFISAEAKYALVGYPVARQRRVVSILDFAKMENNERTGIFRHEHPVFRRGDIAVKGGCAFVVAGIKADKRLIGYPLDAAKGRQEFISVGPGVTKIVSDVLGRQLHRLRKDPRGIAPVPYRLRGECVRGDVSGRRQ